MANFEKVSVALIREQAVAIRSAVDGGESATTI